MSQFIHSLLQWSIVNAEFESENNDSEESKIKWKKFISFLIIYSSAMNWNKKHQQNKHWIKLKQDLNNSFESKWQDWRTILKRMEKN